MKQLVKALKWFRYQNVREREARRGENISRIELYYTSQVQRASHLESEESTTLQNLPLLLFTPLAVFCEPLPNSYALPPPSLTGRPACLGWNSPYATSSFPVYAELVPAVGGTVDAATSPSIAMLVSTAKDLGIYLIGGSIPEKEVQADGSTNVFVPYFLRAALPSRRTFQVPYFFTLGICAPRYFYISSFLSSSSSSSSFFFFAPFFSCVTDIMLGWEPTPLLHCRPGGIGGIGGVDGVGGADGVGGVGGVGCVGGVGGASSALGTTRQSLLIHPGSSSESKYT